MKTRAADKQARPNPELHAVVLAGGAGTRFWPLSREAHPKPLLALEHKRTLFEETLRRAQRISNNIWLVCGAQHARNFRAAARATVRRTTRLRVLVEARGRNTAAAVALAAHRIARAHPQALMAVLSADHRIPDTRAFAAAINAAARAAASADALLTLGVRPTRAETGYGYIRPGAPLAAHPGVYRVRRFVEKPAPAQARRLLRAGNALWNAGIFVFRARVLLAELARCAPKLSAALQPLGACTQRELPAEIARVYSSLPSQPLDTAVLEKSRRVACLPVDFEWGDIGTWQSLARALGAGKHNRALRGEVLAHAASGNLVLAASKKTVALLGVSNLAVIDTGDALLVADLQRSAEVRELAAALRRQGRKELL